MKHSPVILLLILCVCAIVPAQVPNGLLRQISEIRLLESDREDVRRVLFTYVADDGDHYQEFSSADLDITVFYSSGTCSADDDNDDDSTMWKVEEGKVTRIEISPREPLKLNDLAPDLSKLVTKLVRERRYSDAPEYYVYHDKGRGLAVETYQDGVEKIIIFPARGKTKMLCDAGTAVKEFYSRKSWFDEELEERLRVISCSHPNVVDVELGAAEIAATSNRAVAVATTAVDPENNVLAYNYTVSGGRIKGNGAKVVWDLTGVIAGRYTITAGVDDGCGVCGMTVTKSILVR